MTGFDRIGKRVFKYCKFWHILRNLLIESKDGDAYNTNSLDFSQNMQEGHVEFERTNCFMRGES